MDCFICLEKDVKKSIVKNPSLDSFDKLLKRTRERASYKDVSVSSFVARTENLTPTDLFEQKLKYHESCYANFANTGKLQRARKRYNESIDTGESSVIKRKAGRPSISSVEETVEGLTTRSKSEFYNKQLCIICQKHGGKLHCVQTKATGNSMLEVSERLPDKQFFRRLNSINTANDAIANDVMYHNICWADAKKKSKPKLKQIENFTRTLSDIELINYIETELVQQQTDRVLDMNIVNSMYREILLENGENPENLASNYKKYIKELIQDNIPDIVFVKSTQKNKPDKLMTNLTQTEAINTYTETEADESDIKALWKLAKRIRSEVLSQKWEFTGNLKSYESPTLLSTFLKWVLLGPHTEVSNEIERGPDIEKLMQTTSQFVSQNIKTSRQMNYHLERTNTNTYSKIETPLNVGVGLYTYHVTRSKKLINFLSDLNIGINYKKVVGIKKNIVQAVLGKMNENNGIFIPSSLTKDQPVFFAIDNIDLAIDTPDGKRQLHGTATAVYQQKLNIQKVKAFYMV